jgi:hypothetical protein
MEGDGGSYWAICCLLAILRTSAVYSLFGTPALVVYISANQIQIRWPPNFVYVLSEAEAI